MKKQVLFFAAISYFTIFSKGYSQDAKSFSLKQCVDYALQNQSAMKNATLGEEISKAKVREVTGMGLPQINGSIQFTHNDPLRRIFGVGNGQFNFLKGAVVPSGEVFAIPNFFQLANGGDAGATISQLIFSSSYLIGLQAAKTYRELSAKSTEQTKIQIIEQVTKAYYMVLVNEERLKLFEKNIARVDSMFLQTKAMYQNGVVEKLDLDRIEVAYNNIVTEKEKFSNLLALSKVLLKYQMSMPLDNDLVLSEKIEDFKAQNIAEVPQKPNYSGRIEYSLLETQKRLQWLDLKNNRAAYLPSLAAFANIGYFSQSPKFDFISKNNGWYGYGIFGVTMNVPIFDGLQKHHKIQQSKLNLQMIENNISTLEHSIKLQIKTADITLKNSWSSMQLQQKNLDLAKEVARVTKIKYEQGVGSNLEVVTAEASLKEAQTNYYNSLYDYLVAKVDLDKALGNIK